MNYRICSRSNDEHIDTFFQLFLATANELGSFNSFSSDADVIQILENIPDSFTTLSVDLLPEDIRVSCNSRAVGAGSYDDVNIKFTVTPRSDEHQKIMKTFQNKEVIALVGKRESSSLYGNTYTPLLFTFSEINGVKPEDIKGFSVTLRGKVLGCTRFFDAMEITVFNRGLAFDLTGGLS